MEGDNPPTKPAFSVSYQTKAFLSSSSINQPLELPMEQKHSSPSLPSYYSSLVELYRRFTAQLKLLSEYTNDSCDSSFLPTRNGHVNQWIARVTQARGGGSEHEDATYGKTSKQESSCSEGRSQYRRHEFIARLICMPPMPYYQHVFILDSGASRHMASDKSLFSPPVRTITPSDSIAAAYRARDGRLLAVAGVGTISHQRDFQLPDVLYVPDISTGVVVVSVPQLAERGYLIMLGGGQCHVKDQSSGKMVGKGRLHAQDGLYHLEFLNIPSDTMDSTAPCLHSDAWP